MQNQHLSVRLSEKSDKFAHIFHWHNHCQVLTTKKL